MDYNLESVRGDSKPSGTNMDYYFHSVSENSKPKNTKMDYYLEQPVSMRSRGSTQPSTVSVKSKPLRVLCLHGLASNVDVMKYQLQPFQKILGSAVEFDFVSGLKEVPPNPNRKKFDKSWTKNPVVKKLFSEGKFYTWDQGEVHPGKVGPEIERIVQITPAEEERKRMMPFARMDKSLQCDCDDFVKYKYLDTTLQMLRQKIETDGPYDCLLGVSMSCLHITALTAWYQHHHGKVPWRFNMLVCPFPMRDNEFLRKYMSTTINFPHLITYGTADEFLGYVERSVVEYKNASLVLHTGKHRFPEEPDVRIKMCQALLSLNGRIPSRL